MSRDWAPAIREHRRYARILLAVGLFGLVLILGGIALAGFAALVTGSGTVYGIGIVTATLGGGMAALGLFQSVLEYRFVKEMRQW